MDVPLNKITYYDGKHIHGINTMEDGTGRQPLASTIVSISESLGISPDILLYSFGHLPKKEREIITSDPFFYREKILELCNNHESRYQEQKNDPGKEVVNSFDNYSNRSYRINNITYIASFFLKNKSNKNV